MKHNGFLLMICLCVGLCSSCKSGSAYKAQDLDGKWLIIGVKDEPVKLALMPFLEFEVADNHVSGNVGCNNFSAGFELDAKDASAFTLISPAITTMACIFGDTEDKIVKALNEVVAVKGGSSPNRVILIDIDGNTCLVLEKN
ncbi:MAG: META domain-containing protein [Tannerella sp.]|jgi:heat shock protein HslJ|nr:META domain-containing protein [Tannerella sp.]